MNLFANVSRFRAVAADLVEQGRRRAGLEQSQRPSAQALAQARLDSATKRDDRRTIFVHELLRHTLLHYLLHFLFYVGNQSLLELAVRC